MGVEEQCTFLSSDALSENRGTGVHHNAVHLLTGVVWNFDSFENNFGNNRKFTKYLKENCEFDIGQHFSLKYFALQLLTGVVWNFDFEKELRN